MSAIVKRRGSIAAVLLLVLGLAAVLVTSSMRDATAQTGRVIWSFQLQDYVEVSNGHGAMTFDLSEVGPNPTMGYALCTGNRPRTGPNIPAQVVTDPVFVDGFALRILGNTGRALTATVGVNCIFTVETDDVPEPAPTSLENKATGARVAVKATKS